MESCSISIEFVCKMKKLLHNKYVVNMTVHLKTVITVTFMYFYHNQEKRQHDGVTKYSFNKYAMCDVFCPVLG